MSLYIQPITHDNVFFYSGSIGVGHGFYVTISHRGIPHTHCRADSSRLHRLLTYQPPTEPALTMHGTVVKGRSMSYKDETEHFYCAQLIHYGLKPLKTKGPAKKALLQAFGNGDTLVVPPHILQLESQLKAEYEALATQAKIEWQAREKAEKQVQEHGRAEVRKKLEIEPTEISEDESASRKQAATSSKVVRDSETKQTTGCELQKLTHKDTSGVFDVQAPGISEEWPDMCRGGLTLKMSPSKKTGHHLWAYFDFGVVSGTMRCAYVPTSVGQSCTFTWRGREQYESQLIFGSGNKGTITFLGNGKLKGVIEGGCVGKTQFIGTGNEKASHNKIWIMYVPRWKAEYRKTNRSAYEVAAAGRWGRWVDDTSRPDPPEDSDSSGCVGVESDSDMEGSASDNDQDSTSEIDMTCPAPALPEREAPAPPRRKQTARRGGWQLSKAAPPRKQTARRGGWPAGTVPTDRGKTMDAAPLETKGEQAVKLSPQDISGWFDVQAPEFVKEWSSVFDTGNGLSLEILPSSTGSHLWASFDFGIVFGFMRCSAPPTTVGGSCAFTWRGEDTSQHEMTFDDANIGELTFLGNGKIQGVIEGSFFKATFSGTSRGYPRSLKEWKTAYRSINNDAHSAASRRRWGKSVQPRSYDEGPADSDTSDGEEDRSSDAEEHIYDRPYVL